MHFRPTLSGKCLSPALLQRPPRRRRVSASPEFPALLQLPRVSDATYAGAPCLQRLWVPALLAVVPHIAVEPRGHAQVLTPLAALVRRQAGRAGWTAAIGYKNTEEQKF